MWHSRTPTYGMRFVSGEQPLPSSGSLQNTRASGTVARSWVIYCRRHQIPSLLGIAVDVSGRRRDNGSWVAPTLELAGANKAQEGVRLKAGTLVECAKTWYQILPGSSLPDVVISRKVRVSFSYNSTHLFILRRNHTVCFRRTNQHGTPPAARLLKPWVRRYPSHIVRRPRRAPSRSFLLLVLIAPLPAPPKRLRHVILDQIRDPLPLFQLLLVRLQPLLLPIFPFIRPK